jgi:hypothetical protein
MRSVPPLEGAMKLSITTLVAILEEEKVYEAP